ncbi:MAG: baeRF10 domain-containing protein, partial [Anaerolineae bacterium]
VLDRESIRLFSVSGGRINAETESFGEQLKRHKQGGWAAARYQRHDDNIGLHNLKQAIELLETFVTESGYNRVILAGSEEILRQVHEMLPGSLRKQVIGEFVADIRIGPMDILSLSNDLLTKTDQTRESELVSETITAAAKGGAGVRGLADALYTLREGRLRQLLVSGQLQSAGHACTHCHYLAVEPFTVCPFCGNRTVKQVDDVVNEAIVRALRSSVSVNIIRDNPELDAVGGVAATLRY